MRRRCAVLHAEADHLAIEQGKGVAGHPVEVAERPAVHPDHDPQRRIPFEFTPYRLPETGRLRRDPSGSGEPRGGDPWGSTRKSGVPDRFRHVSQQREFRIALSALLPIVGIVAAAGLLRPMRRGCAQRARRRNGSRSSRAGDRPGSQRSRECPARRQGNGMLPASSGPPFHRHRRTPALRIGFCTCHAARKSQGCDGAAALTAT